MLKEYKAAYSQLNPAQKEAVDTIDGPVLVVAGPGTGKTQLLSLRVANILLKTDSDASNILCLTFTNKAAANMRQRLNLYIGPESRDVNVRTFHGFAAEIMNQYPDNFWNGARLSVAPDAIQLEIIKDVLSSLPLSNPLSSTFAGSYTALNDVKQALKLTKEAGLDPLGLKTTVALNLKYIQQIESKMIDILSPTLSNKKLDSLEEAISKLPSQEIDDNNLLLPLDIVIKQSLATAVELDAPTGKTKHTGKWKAGWIQTINGKKSMHYEIKRNQWWLSIADVYAQYRVKLHKRGYYDYSDMLIEVLDQLKKSAEMKADLQERYPYILIDEFQDTNAAQLLLATIIADHYSANNKPNIMAVGDDDQSIFAFNGAELNNMLNFQSRYPGTKLVVLTENYRSTQGVLDSADKIISLAEDRLIKRMPGISKVLNSNIEPLKCEITQTSYPTRQHQQYETAKTIKRQWGKGERDIAVLARKHESLEQLAYQLNTLGVPIRYERRNNVLDQEAVKLIYLISKTAVAIAEGKKDAVNTCLAQLLRHPVWNIQPQILWQMAVENYSNPDWFDSLLQNNAPELNKIGNWLAWLSRNINDKPLPLMINYIIGLEEGEYLKSPFKDYYFEYRKINNAYLDGLSAINLLRQLSVEFTDQLTTLDDFVRFIDLNFSTKSRIADESWFVSGDKAVELLTVYKAKGLEYDHVYVVDAVESNWQPRSGGRTSPANLRLQSYGEKYDDYIRLLYVAITRARHSFNAASYLYDDTGKDILPTPLLASIPITKSKSTPKDNVEILENDLRWPSLKNKDAREMLTDRLENYSLSQSAYTDFLNLAEAGPAGFLERHLIRIPTAKSLDGSYGTAIHSALETAQRLVNTSKIDTGTVMDRFEAALSEEHISPTDYNQLSRKGEELLSALLKGGLKIPKDGLAEQRFTDIRIDDSLINGKIDLIEIKNNKLLISDYKTGKPLNSFETKDKIKQIKAWRHRNQMVFYAILAKNSPRYKKYSTVNTQMIYLEAESTDKMHLRYTPTNQDIVRMTKLINTIWKHVKDFNFPDTTKYPKNISGITEFEDDLIDGRI